MDTLIPLGKLLAETILPPLITVIAGLLVGVLVRQLQKLGVTVTKEKEDRLRLVVEDAVRAVEEAARRNPRMSSSGKETLAKQLAVEQIGSAVPAERLQLAIDAALPKIRMELAGQPGSSED